MPNQKEENPKYVRMVRFKAGYDVLAEVINDTDPNLIHLLNPLCLEIDVDPASQRQKIYMFPWLPQGIVKENQCIIDKAEVLFMGELQEDILGYYSKMCYSLFSDEAVEKYKKEKAALDEQMGDKVVSLFKTDTDKVH